VAAALSSNSRIIEDIMVERPFAKAEFEVSLLSFTPSPSTAVLAESFSGVLHGGFSGASFDIVFSGTRQQECLKSKKNKKFGLNYSYSSYLEF